MSTHKTVIPIRKAINCYQDDARHERRKTLHSLPFEKKRSSGWVILLGIIFAGFCACKIWGWK